MNNKIPLVIDLDGTLIKSDLLVESWIGFIRQNPLNIFTTIKWLFAGKIALKENLALNVEIDAATLPYDLEVIELIKAAKLRGRKIILATASHMIYAKKIAQHLEFFDEVLATEKKVNLSAKNKRDKLVEKFGKARFDYAGNSLDDLAVWKKAHKSYVVNPETGVEKKARKIGNVAQVIKSKNCRFKTWIKALRLHQWVKNLLIFVPLLSSHKITHIDLFLNGILAFIFFGLCASSTYLLNDLIDIEDDRHHKTKHRRAFAAGNLSILNGIFAIPIFLIFSFLGAFYLLPLKFLLVLIIYYILTIAYSFKLKRIMALDAIILSLLYTIRLIAGTYAFNLASTSWMLAFSMFIFLSLSLVKRYTELYEGRSKGKNEITRGRGYYPADLEIIASLGAAAGYLSVMVLALYIQDPATSKLYRHPHLIWLACPLLLYWISRVWLLTNRGLMNDDPVIFAIKDKVSWVVGALFGMIFWLSI
jgi:4-hydroxybenzoate polyprenyltransferase